MVNLSLSNVNITAPSNHTTRIRTVLSLLIQIKPIKCLKNYFISLLSGRKRSLSHLLEQFLCLITPVITVCFAFCAHLSRLIIKRNKATHRVGVNNKNEEYFHFEKYASYYSGKPWLKHTADVINVINDTEKTRSLGNGIREQWEKRQVCEENNLINTRNRQSKLYTRRWNNRRKTLKKQLITPWKEFRRVT